MTRFGVVVRADNVRLLSDEGWEQLVGYGVRRIVDLIRRRFPDSREADTD